MISIENLLRAALKQVNTSYSDYQVAVRSDCKLSFIDSIELDLVYPERMEPVPIGAVHFIKQVLEPDQISYKEELRTLQELIAAIKKAVKIHFEAKENPDALITSVGTVFYKNGHHFIVNKNGNFELEGKILIQDGKPWKEEEIYAEESLTLQKIEEGKFHLISPCELKKDAQFFVLPNGEVKIGEVEKNQ